MSNQHMASPDIQPLNRNNRRNTQVFNVGSMRNPVVEEVVEEEEEAME